MLGVAEGTSSRCGSPGNRFSHENSLPPTHPCQLMTVRTRPMSQRIIEVEAKSLDDSTNGEPGQARLSLVGRGPTVGERRMYDTP
jgi:hypothetical protein